MQLQNNGGINIKSPIFDGLYRKNTVFVSGLVIAPVVYVADTVYNAFLIMIAFSVITFLTIIISSFVSKNIVYTVRIILYILIASIVYVPVLAFLKQSFPNTIEKLGIMLPLLIANSMILIKTELRFTRESKGMMIIDLLSYIIGFDIAIIIVAFIREVIGKGEIGGKLLGIPVKIDILRYPFGTFILIGLCGALIRWIVSAVSDTE